MRPIAPLSFEEFVPADLAGQPQPDFDLVSPFDLWVDETYQRSQSPKSFAFIRHIAENWSWPKFNPPICARIDGRLHVLSGQHTAIAAATHGGIKIIPVVVVSAPEMVERARACISHAVDRVATTAPQIWHAQLAAGDEAARAIQAVCQQAGVTLLPFAPGAVGFQPGQTISIVAIRKLLRHRGPVKAVMVLRSLSAADLTPITGDMIRAADALLCEPEYATEMDPERLTATIRSLGARAHTEAREVAAAKALPAWRAMVATLFKNRQKRPSPTHGITRTASGGHMIDLRPVSTVVHLGEPGPGRSALDERRRAAS